MPLMLGSKTYDPIDNFNTTPGLFDEHPCIGLYFATPAGHALVSAINPLPVTGGGGGGVGITDTDDNSIAPGQTTLLAIDENYIYDAVAGVWIRWQGGIDNAVAPASPQGAFVGGIVTDPVDVFVDGDISLLHFDTSGRLLCNATFTFPSTEDDDNAIAAGALARAEVINIPYFSNLDNTSIWERWTGRNDDDSVDTGDGSPTIIGLNYVWDRDSASPDVWRRKPGRTEDNSISEGQFQPTEVGLTYVFNPTVSDWVRLQGGTDNAVGPATPQIAFVGGIVTDPVDVFADGDVSALHFDTSGRLLISGSVIVTPFATTADDDAIASGATLEYLINLNYGFDGTDWRRENVRDATSSISESLMHLLTRSAVSALNTAAGAGSQNEAVWGRAPSAFEGVATGVGTALWTASVMLGTETGAGVYHLLEVRNADVDADFTETLRGALTNSRLAIQDGSDWIIWQGAVNNAVAPAAPQGAFTVGLVRTSFDVFVAGDAYVPQGTVDGATIVIPRTQEPFEVATSQATIAAAGIFTSASIQQNSLFAGSLGRHNLQGFMHYAGTASSVTIAIQISLDSGATFITTDTFTVVSGTATVIRDLCIAMGNRLRIQITNNDGANSTGTTNIGFYLTHAS